MCVFGFKDDPLCKSVKSNCVHRTFNASETAKVLLTTPLAAVTPYHAGLLGWSRQPYAGRIERCHRVSNIRALSILNKSDSRLMKTWIAVCLIFPEFETSGVLFFQNLIWSERHFKAKDHERWWRKISNLFMKNIGLLSSLKTPARKSLCRSGTDLYTT